MTLPHGVRFIFSMDGSRVEEVSALRHGENYVCSSQGAFKRMDYLRLAQEQSDPAQQWQRIRRDAYYFGGGGGVAGSRAASGAMRRESYKMSGHSKSFGQAKAEAAMAGNANGVSEEQRIQVSNQIRRRRMKKLPSADLFFLSFDLAAYSPPPSPFCGEMTRPDSESKEEKLGTWKEWQWGRK